MNGQRGWLAAALAVALVAAGWLGWREAKGRQAYYADSVGHLTYQVNMANRQLLRARETQLGPERLEAMAIAHGYLVTAHVEALSLMERIAPSRQGQPAYMPALYLPMLLQYARDLSPEMPDESLQRRIELLKGLEAALREARTGQSAGPHLSFVVDLDGLKQSLDDYFRPMAAESEPGRSFQFTDAPNPPTVTARQQGTELTVRLDFARTYKLFPLSAPGCELLVRAGGRVTVSSDAGALQRMGTGKLEPFTLEEGSGSIHQVVSRYIPHDWGEGSYQVIRVPEGLAQTLRIRLPGEARTELLLLNLRLGANAVPIVIQP